MAGSNQRVVVAGCVTAFVAFGLCSASIGAALIANSLYVRRQNDGAAMAEIVRLKAEAMERAERDAADPDAGEALDPDVEVMMQEGFPAMKPGDYFLYGTLAESPDPVPFRYRAKIANVPGPTFGDPKDSPPIHHVVDGVCTGNADLRAQYAASIDRAAVEGDEDLDFDDGYAFWLEYCLRPEFCAWSAKAGAASKHETSRALLYRLAATCGDPALAPAFEDPRAPLESVNDFHFNLWLSDRKARYTPRLAEDLQARIATADPESSLSVGSVRRAAQVIAMYDEPDAVKALLDAHAKTRQPVLRDAIAIGMTGLADPRAVKLRAEACARPDPDEDCRDALDDWNGRIFEPENLAENVRESSFDVARFLEVRPSRRAAVVAAAQRCKDPENDPLTTCLGHLAAADWAAARAQMRRISSQPVDEEMGTDWKADVEFQEMRSALDEFESLAALVRHLESAGLVRAKPSLESAEWGIDFAEASPRRLLARGGLVFEIESDAEFFPVHYDHLLRRLAAYASPALDDVVFGQDPPPKAQREAGKYTFHAWAGGKHWSMNALGSETEYEFSQPIAFLNALLRTRGSNLRAISLVDEGSYDGAILVAPEAAIRKAIGDGLLRLPAGEPPEASEDGEGDDEEE